MPRSYPGDPYWMRARYNGACACPERHLIRKGDNIFYYPNGRKAYVGECADRAERDFIAAAQDEDAVSGGFS